MTFQNENNPEATLDYFSIFRAGKERIMPERKENVADQPISPEKRICHQPGSRYPHSGLGSLQRYPDHWEVELIDEVFTPYQYRDNLIEADLVGFGAFTFSVNRAYEIAAATEKGIPTCWAAFMPVWSGRSRTIVDTIVVGEAEETVWPKLIADFEAAG
jgi:hypothetical protein